MDASCLHCGSTFRAARRTKRFCSSKCRVAYFRAQSLSVTEKSAVGTISHTDEISSNAALQTHETQAQTAKKGKAVTIELRFHRVNDVTFRICEGDSDKPVGWLMEVGWAMGAREAWHVRWKDVQGRQLSSGPHRLAKAKELAPLLIGGGFEGAVAIVHDPVQYLQRIATAP